MKTIVRARRRKVLSRSWFARPALVVARELLGKYLVRRFHGREFSAMVTEVEAYTGPEDLASHAAHGKKTKRTAVMFGPAGRWYVYFTYGMHWLANIVTGREGYPAAVLIRAVRLPSAPLRTGRSPQGVLDISGPARVARTFYIAGSFTGMPANRRSGLWIEDRGVRFASSPSGSESAITFGARAPSSSLGVRVSRIVRGPRIGVGYAGSVWAKKPYRFMVSSVESDSASAPFFLDAESKKNNKLSRGRSHPRS